MKISSKARRYLSRTGGPVLSILLHGVVIYVLLNVVMFRAKPPEPAIQDVAWDQQEPLVLTPVTPEPLPPDLVNPTEAAPVEPLAPEVLQQLNQDVEVAADVPIELPDVLPNLSPLKTWTLGGDAASQKALTDRYGERATRNGLLGSYYNRIDFTGPALMRIDETLNKLWEKESPWPEKIRPELFSVIWTGRIVPKRSGRYTLYLQSDDGARLWINGKVVLNQYTEHARRVDTVQMDMLVGVSYDLKYAFCEVYGYAISQLEWSCAEAGIEKQLIPTDCLWADGTSTRELMAWNEATGPNRFPNRQRMRNPALLEGVAYSHLVDSQKLTEQALTRMELADLVPDFRRFQQTGRAPQEFTRPSGWNEHISQAEKKPDPREVTIDIL